MKSCTWDHSTTCIDENVWAWQANATLFTLQRLNTLNTNISLTSSHKIYVSSEPIPRKMKCSSFSDPWFPGPTSPELISKFNKFKSKVTQGRPEAWHSIAHLSRTRNPNFILQHYLRSFCFWAWEIHHRQRQNGHTQEVLRKEQNLKMFSTRSRLGTVILSLALLVGDVR